ELRILGYPLRFCFYIWKYLRNEPECAVRSDASGPYIFVSYARADKSIVFDLLATLDAMGVRVFWDEGLTWGEEFEPQLTKAILGSDAVLVCLTPDSDASQFVKREVALASRHRVTILPLELRQTKLTGTLDMLIGSIHRLRRFALREDRLREEL